MSTLTKIDIRLIKESPVALREVDKDSKAYQGLVDSIKQKGFIGAISVRTLPDNTYELIDGKHRLNAAKDAGLTEINVDIHDMDNVQVLEAQLMTNIHKIETSPHQYSQQLKRLMKLNPLLTANELAGKLGQSVQWVNARLSLAKIADPDLAQLIDAGTINLSNAYALAKLPVDEQKDWLDRAITMSPREFAEAAEARIRAVRQSALQGDNKPESVWSPVPKVMKLAEISGITREVCAMLVAEYGITNPVDAFECALKHVLRLDARGIAEQKAQEDTRKATAEAVRLAKAGEKAVRKDVKTAQERLLGL
jgi:ParB/RepB/Spo0J family partition protein